MQELNPLYRLFIQNNENFLRSVFVLFFKPQLREKAVLVPCFESFEASGCAAKSVDNVWPLVLAGQD